MDFDPRDFDSRDDERHSDARSRGGQRGSSNHDRDDNQSQPETRPRDRHDDARSLERGPGNNRQESDQERNRDGDPPWGDRDRDARERDREGPDAFSHMFTCLADQSASSCTTAIANTPCAAPNRERSRPLVHSEWSPVVISETTMGARLIHGAATCDTCANKG